MSSAPDIHELTDAVLRRAYGERTFDRGRAYADQDRAVAMGSTPGSIKGLVEGSGGHSYITKVHWERRANGVALSDACSCPVGDGCKHCVALILTARRAAPSPHAGAGDDSWRRALSGVVRADAPAPSSAVPLALEISVERSPTRWGGLPPRVLHIRPLRQGKTGGWIKTGASWRDVLAPESYRSYRSTPALDPTHTAVLAAMAASAQLSPYYSEQRPIGLDRFGPMLWFHLARAVEAGVELLGAGARPGGVDLAPEPAVATVDLTAAADGAVTVTCRLRVGDRTLELRPEDVVFLGTPAHGVVVLEPGVLHLVPLAEPLHPDLAKLLTSPPLVVPPGDVDEFLDGYQPTLARLATVGSSDGSVTIAESTFDRLVMAVHRPSIDTAAVQWLFRYRRGERTRDVPLDDSGPGSRRGAAILRDRGAERRALDELELPTDLLSALVDRRGGPADVVVRGADAVALLDEVVPWLRERGQVDVEVTGDVPDLREATTDPLISLSVTDGAGIDADRPDGDRRPFGNDWFDLGIEVTVDGEVVEFATLFAALALGQELLILPSGTWTRLDRPELARLRALIEEARGLVDPGGDAVARVNAFQTSWWDELAGLGVVEQQSARWAAAVARMRELRAPEPVAVPRGLTASLRHYQREGLDWLVFLYRNGLGGILADDMGLGKTVQTLALCLHVLEERPDARVLVVAPTSVVENWHREAAHFAPGLRVRTVHETKARRHTDLAEAVGDASLVVTSYALFRLEFEQYQQLGWDLLLLDEAQFVKNHTSKTYQCVRRLDAATKVAITGTPLENSLMDLWSLLSITAPGLYPDPKRFAEVYRTPIEGGRGADRLATLRRRIAPLVRRRTKDEVLTELPPKIEQTVEVELSARHARLYQRQLQRERTKVLGLVDDVQRNRFEILKSLTLLRQLSLHPGLVDPDHESVGSAKLDQLVSDLTQVVAEGHRALVFSQFTRFLARVRTRLDELGIDHAYLDGRTRRRAEAIASFKDGDVPVFVISLKAGGFGLNLTEADYCFVLDPWWNPAVETQAVDRAHRMGQQNPVVVYRYVSSGTIEEKVVELKARKAALFAGVMDDEEGALSGPLSADDIRGLFDGSG